MASLAAPVKVSALIKTGRYAALITGFLYGASHFKSLQKKENILREEEAKMAPIRAAKLAEEKLRLNKIEMDLLGKEVGIVAPST